MSISLCAIEFAVAVLLQCYTNIISEQERACTNKSSYSSANKYFNSNTDTTYRIIPSVNNTYGYEIMVRNKVLIRQQTIPGMTGLQGFKRKQDAEKIARLVIKKIEQGFMPPTIEKKDLEDLKIKH